MKKGLILLQLLACKSLLITKEFCKEIAIIIYKAIAEFRDSQNLQAEVGIFDVNNICWRFLNGLLINIIWLFRGSVTCIDFI